MTDPIADMLTRIRNANLVKLRRVEMPHSTTKEAIARVLLAENYLDSVEVVEAKPQKLLIVTLKFINGKPAINSLRRISKPGRRVYSQAKDLKQILAGMGMTIISTSQGLKTNRQARSEKIGGEVICEVW